MKRKPRALGEGDTVAIVAPSGVVRKELLDRGVARLESMGLRVTVMKSVLEEYGYLAGQDRDRAKDFTDAWTDPGIHGVISARGGYGVTRMLRYLDYDALRPHKKVFAGYSDITALHMALWRRLRLVTFHGPMAETREGAGLDEPYNREMMGEALMGDPASGNLKLPEGVSLTALSGGYAEGELVGGNLSLIAASIGTRYESGTRGKVLFLEDVGEAPYRVDRMLCQLEGAGKLDDAAAFLIGDFTDCEAKEGSASFAVGEVLEQYLAGRGKPCLSGIPAGHGRFNATLPMGVRIAVDADRGSVVALERAVI